MVASLPTTGSLPVTESSGRATIPHMNAPEDVYTLSLIHI